MKQIRVVVLDDSAICRVQLAHFLQAEGDIEVVGEAASGEHALEIVQQTRPHLLIVDLQMPGTDGHETIVQVMANTPLPILVVTSQRVGPDRQIVFEAIRKGALDLAEKPALLDLSAQSQLRSTVRRLATVPVVRHVAGKLNERPKSIPKPSIFPPLGNHSLVIGIGSSAGGPLALASLLAAWDRTLNASVIVVQHLPANFLAVFGEFLAARSTLSVVVVTSKQSVQPGAVYIAGREAHIGLVSPDTVGLIDGPTRDGHRPSADVLFESLARHAGRRASGIVLSGIGRDGADGLKMLRDRGGYCLAQDQETSAVWGMPRAALEGGAAEAALPPRGLAEVVSRWTRAGGKV